MTRNITRIAGPAVAAFAGASVLAGCTVAGDGSASPSDVAAYQTTIASSRAAAAASALSSACTTWSQNLSTRLVASRATAAFTKTPGWQWDGIAGLVNAELAAVATESGKLPGIIGTANLQPTAKTLFTDYRTKLDAYGEALRADAQARGSEAQTWAKRNPASETLIAAEKAIQATCPRS
ncbi:hypothetical protein FK268_13890 [Tsukamurella sputi]|uniref:Lipoprotein n=1 Tax=Tsukamurella sputi TaxID=2591848 RepID=A0A5C5RKZ3_9ACTN|nr:hypothetical protein [Tsukamurella sputi]TWS23378.1 hypothetical protein FK268_13890 [Tsukamurella sputi]